MYLHFEGYPEMVSVLLVQYSRWTFQCWLVQKLYYCWKGADTAVSLHPPIAAINSVLADACESHLFSNDRLMWQADGLLVSSLITQTRLCKKQSSVLSNWTEVSDKWMHASMRMLIWDWSERGCARVIRLTCFRYGGFNNAIASRAVVSVWQRAIFLIVF